MLVGVLGGPVGMLLGLGTGGLIGGLYDVDEADIQDQTLAQVGRHVPPGSNALLAEVDETINHVVDGAMKAQGGAVLRRSADDVLAEIEVQKKLLRSHRGRPARKHANARRPKCTRRSTKTAKPICARSCTSADISGKFSFSKAVEPHGSTAFPMGAVSNST
jgi:Protein of unknown function (DUF1269)